MSPIENFRIDYVFSYAEQTNYFRFSPTAVIRILICNQHNQNKGA